ncbi:hypothetical protein PM082_019831 [Marasmius tenuissimus]|nr:hypothetical protein PM082_019831 [Marasmius tenuissimus]
MDSGKSSSVQCNEKSTSSPPMVQERRTHRYRGHRSNSFTVSSDDPLLVEVRARQRTFNGAYGRTALGNLGYSLTILRLFDKRFYKIGLAFAILGALLFIISFFRDRHSRHDFADEEDSNCSSYSCSVFGGSNIHLVDCNSLT